MRLLLVDDEPMCGTLMRRVAEGCGLEVEIAPRGDAFKAAYEARQPDIIGLDLSLPDCDGIELLRYLEERGCQAQIVVMSGFDGQMLNVARDLGAARGLNMAGQITKPMGLREMRAVLENARAASILTRGAAA